MIIDKLKENKDFCNAFSKTADDYSQRHNRNKKSGELYVLEETSWILSLSLLHLDKEIYLIHVGNDNPAIRTLFHIFPNLYLININGEIIQKMTQGFYIDTSPSFSSSGQEVVFYF